MKEHTFKEIIPEQTILKRVDALAAEINAMYAGEPLVAVCVLKGAFLFYADLIRRLDVAPEIDFVRLASYGQRTERKQEVVFTKDLEVDVESKHVLVVEDIVDTGRSMDFLLNVLRLRRPASVRVCSLLDKRERREVDLLVDFPGFILDKGFVVGYGLDYAEKYREMRGIYEVIF